MLRHFQMFADYNRWANARVYDACAELSEDEFRADQGAFFGSAQRTLNHLLAADRIWLKRFTGEGETPTSLDAVLFDAFDALRTAREAADERLIAYVGSLTDEDVVEMISFSTATMPTKIELPLGPILSHVFNHQTHHRGQVHTILTSLGKPSIVLDLIYFLRNEGQRWQ